MPLPSGLRRSVRNQAEHVLETGQRFTRFDQIRQRHFWSSYYFAPDTNGYIQSNRFPLFVVPTGQNGQGFPSGVQLTLRETNWSSQNRVPDNQNFEITELGVSLGVLTPDVFNPYEPGEIDNSNPANMSVPAPVQAEFLNNTVVSITYLTNSVPLGLAADFAQASAPQIGTHVNQAGQDVAVAFPSDYRPRVNSLFRSNGFPAPALRRRFKIPILLQHGETFSFAFEIPRSFWIGKAINNANPQNELITGVTPFVARFDFWATESFVEKS